MPRALKHILIWTAYFAYVSITDYILAGFRINILEELSIYLSHNILLFYSLLYCYRTYNTETAQKTLRSILRFVAAIALFLACRYSLEFLPLLKNVWPSFHELGAVQWWTLSILWISRYAVISLAYYYFHSYQQKRKENERLATEQQLQIQQQLSLENKLLRAQIDPHFLYNALNSLYAKALPVSKDLGEAILKLAEIMRYAIKPNPTSKTVPLTEELEHIRNVVDIARFRFNNKLCLELSIEGDFNGVEVVPLAFITLAENVLKHANLNDPAAPGRIQLQWLEPSVLAFTTWNRKRSSREFPSNGIGLNNTIDRLKDHYGNACTISVEDGVDHFYLTVVIRVEQHGAPAAHQNLGQVLRS